MPTLRPGQCPSRRLLGPPVTEEQMAERSRGHASKARTLSDGQKEPMGWAGLAQNSLDTMGWAGLEVTPLTTRTWKIEKTLRNCGPSPNSPGFSVESLRKHRGKASHPGP